MSTIAFHKITPADKKSIEQIADWYKSEWNISMEMTIQRITSFPISGFPFQVLMSVDDVPVATAGIYSQVSLLEYDARFRIYSPWLALVYTLPRERKKGFGALICERIELMSKEIGLKEIYLYTFTAESLYKKLNWEQVERFDYRGKDAVLMKKKL